jgi:hypothetical protein
VFQRGSDAQTLIGILNTIAPAPSTVRAELAGGPWDAFCARALLPDADARFQTATEMSAALSHVMEKEGTPKPGELAAFLRRVEEAPDTSTSDVETKVEMDAPTVKEPRSE